jgi:pimeloyl-ACP methyl ester carboxylesterase
MGGVATVAAAANLGKRIRAIALWSSGPLIRERIELPEDGGLEESGQRVSLNYWREALARDFMKSYSRVEVPAYFVFGTADPYTPEEAWQMVEANCKPGDRVRVFEGLPHTTWPVHSWNTIREETIDTYLQAFR